MVNITDRYEWLLSEVTRMRYNGDLKAAVQLIEKKLGENHLTKKSKFNHLILKATILNTMGIYSDLNLMLDELLNEIDSTNMPIEYFEANLLKITSLKRMSQREEGFRLIEKITSFLDKQKEIPLEKRTQFQAALLYQKGDYFWHKGNPDQASYYLNQSLEIIKKSPDDQELLGMVYNRIGTIYYNRGMFEEGLVYFKKSLGLQLDLMNKKELARIHNNIGATNFQKGEYDIALKNFEKSYVLNEELGNKTDIGIPTLNIGMIHLFVGNYEKASQYLKNALKINEKVQNDYPTSYSLHYLIQLSIEVNAPKDEVVNYLTKLEKLYQTSKSNVVRDRFLFSKGLILKSSNRLAEKMNAQKYFKQVVKDSSSLFDIASEAYLNLIELLLLELKSTESFEVLTEIEDLTDNLLKIAEKQNLAPILVKTYLLQSKLSLLKLEIDQAKKLLDKAEELAEKKNLQKLSVAIMKQQKELYDKLGSWENLTKKNTSIRERVEMTQIEDTLLQMINHKLEIMDDLETLYKEFSIEKLSLVIFRFGITGAEFFKGVYLPTSENIERELLYMSSMLMTVLGQGNKYHLGLFGPLPLPLKDYSAIIYSRMMKDREQADIRMKGETYSLFCILYPQHYSSLFYKRDAITKIFKTKLEKIHDLNDLAEDFLIELRQEVYFKITEVFSPKSIIDTSLKVPSNFNQLEN